MKNLIVGLSLLLTMGIVGCESDDVAESHVLDITRIHSLEDFDRLLEEGSSPFNYLSTQSLEELRNSLVFNERGGLASFRFKELEEELYDDELQKAGSFLGIDDYATLKAFEENADTTTRKDPEAMKHFTCSWMKYCEFSLWRYCVKKECV